MVCLLSLADRAASRLSSTAGAPCTSSGGFHFHFQRQHFTFCSALFAFRRPASSVRLGSVLGSARLDLSIPPALLLTAFASSRRVHPFESEPGWLEGTPSVSAAECLCEPAAHWAAAAAATPAVSSAKLLALLKHSSSLLLANRA